MKIVRLEAANVKRLKAVEIVPGPDDSLVVIRGNNANGKSSVLDSIAYALGGKRVQPPRVVRDGTEEAFVVVEFDDGTVIERRWEATGKTVLEVRDRDGVAQRSPQALLDSLVGRLSFDPLAFLALDGAKQSAAVQQVLGLDFTETDREQQAAYDERTVVNREKDRAKARLEALPRVAKVVETINVPALLKEQERLLGIERANAVLAQKAQAAQAAVDQVTVQYKDTAALVKKLEQELADAKLKLGALKERGENARTDADAAQKAFESAEDVDLELVNVRAKLEEAQAQNEAARKNAERDELAATVKAKEKESEDLTEKITSLEAWKAKKMAEAKFPVPGLTFTLTGLKLNDVPFEQASQAERLRVSVAMGLATNPKVRVLLVREGSALDDKSLVLLAKLAHDADAQVWLECVSKGGAGIIIEDGEVEEVRRTG